MIYTFLESPTLLDVHPGKRCALLAEIVEINVAEVGTKSNEIFSLRPNYVPSYYVLFIYYISLHFVGTRGITYA